MTSELWAQDLSCVPDSMFTSYLALKPWLNSKYWTLTYCRTYWTLILGMHSMSWSQCPKPSEPEPQAVGSTVHPLLTCRTWSLHWRWPPICLQCHHHQLWLHSYRPAHVWQCCLFNSLMKKYTRKPALHLSRSLQIRSRMNPSNTTHIAMTHPTPCSEIICHFCDKKATSKQSAGINRGGVTQRRMAQMPYGDCNLQGALFQFLPCVASGGVLDLKHPHSISDHMGHTCLYCDCCTCPFIGAT